MRSRLWLSFVALLLAIAAAAQGAPPNPPYLREMPSIDRVMREVAAGDAAETAARQMGAFIQLTDIIEQLAGVRRYRNQLTPDEVRWITDYTHAYERIAQSKPEYRNPLRAMRGYDVLPDFRNELFNKFFSPQLRAAYEAVDRMFAARHAEFMKQQQQEMEQARAQQKAIQEGGGGTTDPGTLAMRRCVAAGREPTKCLGEAFEATAKGMVAGVAPTAAQPVPSGLRMTGKFANGRFYLTFTEKGVLIGCGAAYYDADYTAEMKNGQVAINTVPGFRGQKLGNKPITFNYAANGQLLGPPRVRMIAEKRVSSSTYQTTETSRKQISEYEARNNYGLHPEQVHRDGSGNLYVDVETPATGTTSLNSLNTEVCELGPITPSGSTGRTDAAQAVGLMAGPAGASAMVGGAPYDGRSDKEKAWPGPGLRLFGTFEGRGGLTLEFHEESVIVGCGEVLSAKSYTVQRSPSQTVVRIEDEKPITLTVQPDMSLAGAGSIQVAGHVFVGDKLAPGQPLSGNMFRAASANCAVSTLARRN